MSHGAPKACSKRLPALWQQCGTIVRAWGMRLWSCWDWNMSGQSTRDGFRKQDVREFLFNNTGIPVHAYDDEGGEGVGQRHLYREITVDGERCYQKFRSPESIGGVVAGGGAGKFSAVIASWATGPRGSQRVTYPCP